MAEEPQELLKRDPRGMPHRNGCSNPGMGCSTGKRGLDNVSMIAKRAAQMIPHHNGCINPAMGCSTGKRGLDDVDTMV